MKKLKSKWMSLLLVIAMLLGLLPMNTAFAIDIDNRIPITEVEGTMTGYEIKFGDENVDEDMEYLSQPTFILTKGSPAHFNINGGNGHWERWNEATGEWEQFRERFFIEGKYSFMFQVRVDGPAGKTHVLNPNCTVKINGEIWGDLKDDIAIRDDFSFGWVRGPEIEVVDPKGKIRAFVKRLYTEVLGRLADNGLNDWVEVLSSKKETGAKVAMGFVDSQEFKNKSISDDEYIEIMYRTFLGRNSDPVGKEGWKKNLDEGVSRMFVFKGFVESDEFTKICDSYGIIRGNVELKAPMDQNEKVTKFVARCYKVFLGRKADEGGINAWTNQLLTENINAKEAARGFVMSPEFQNKGLSNEDYVRTMYIGLMNREADGGGLKGWVDVLERGGSREEIFYGFADSPEFKDLARSYGLSVDW